MKKFSIYNIIIAFSFLILSSCSTFNKMFESKKGKAKSALVEKDSLDHNKKVKDKFKPYKKIITNGAVSDNGFFTVHKVEDKYYFEIPNNLLSRDYLITTKVSKGPNMSFAYDAIQNRDVVSLERIKDAIFMKYRDFGYTANDSLTVKEAVDNSSLEPFIKKFPIQTISTDSTSVVIDVTSLYEQDTDMFTFNGATKKNLRITRIEKDLSYVNYVNSNPKNITSSMVKTYRSSGSSTASPTSTFVLNNSIILLPETLMRKRIYNKKLGYNHTTINDFGADFRRLEKFKHIHRWNLEVADENLEAFKNGELVAPKSPIVFYIENNIPSNFIPYIKRGILSWNKAFEAAGFKNAIVIKDIVSEQDRENMDNGDIRYSRIGYSLQPIDMNSDPIVDPRSGEILQFNYTIPYTRPTILSDIYFKQTAAVNPEVQKVNFDTEVAGKMLQYDMARVLGKAFGLIPNAAGSLAYSSKELRDPVFTKKHGISSSVTDGVYFNHVTQPGDGDVVLIPSVGAYDLYAINWGYRPLPNIKNYLDEEETLNAWISKHSGDPVFNFTKEAKGEKAKGLRAEDYDATLNSINDISDISDPRGQFVDLGSDPVESAQLGVKNIAYAMQNVKSWTEEGEGTLISDTQYPKRVKDLIDDYNQIWTTVIPYIGGVIYDYEAIDQDGDVVFQNVPKALQIKALNFVKDQLLSPPTWLKNLDNTGAFSSSKALVNDYSLNSETLESLLNLKRLMRMVSNEAINGNDAYRPDEYIEDVRIMVFNELYTGETISMERRALQRGYIKMMEFMLSSSKPSEKYRAGISIFGGGIAQSISIYDSDLMAILRNDIRMLRSKANAKKYNYKGINRAHLEDVVDKIDFILDKE